MELITPVRVVLIDDRADHLFAIANAMAISGIPCIWHLYDKTTNALVPPVPQGGYPSVRLVITDLNIRNASGANADPANLAGVLISDVLVPLLPALALPYGLVLWSNIQVKASEVGDYISQRINHAGLPAHLRRSPPLSIGVMDKNSFVSDLSGDGETIDIGRLMAEASGKITEVRKQLGDAVTDSLLKLACAWEARASVAAATTINSVYSAASVHSLETGVSPSEGFRDVFSRLAIGVSGKAAAAETPARALDEGLVDLLLDDLKATEDGADYSRFVNEAIGGALKGRPVLLHDKSRHHLNTELHVEQKIEVSKTKIARGLVLGCDDNQQFSKLLVRGERALMWGDFLFPPDLFEKAAKNADGKANADELKALWAWAVETAGSVDKEANFRLLEIGADCDHAQRKARTVRLLCALELPLKYEKFLRNPGGLGLKSEALVVLGPWVLADAEPTLLVVSVGRFAIHQEWPLPAGLNAKYRLRKALVDVVLHKYSSYSARPGYVEIAA